MTVTYIPLTGRHTFGRDRNSDVHLEGIEISRKHLSVERIADTFVIRDLSSKVGTLINGRHVSEARLIYGDILTVGRHNFRFDGRGLRPAHAGGGVAINAEKVARTVAGKKILYDINLKINPGEFVGILGTSGAGKSTLLDTLSGVRMASSGDVKISGVEVASYLKRGPEVCGYVPQADIVHFELTVRQAVRFAALLRLPKTTPPRVVEDCVDATLDRLQLRGLEHLPIHKISGGQRKRVSVAVEILSRPPLLFLDEPSSGLDPSTEFKLMEQLRELANIGCTVICTTHVMDNVQVFDRLIVLRAGRLIFAGSPEETRSHFRIDRFVQLYERIESRPVDHWLSLFCAPAQSTAAAQASSERRTDLGAQPSNGTLIVLLRRQLALFLTDIKNPLVLIGQPLLIGALVAWVAQHSGFKLFFAHLATFWFGCSNASQEIVKEIAIYSRERLVAVSRGQYLIAKLSFWIAATLMQSAVMFTMLHFGPQALGGNLRWQLVCLFSTSVTGVLVGFWVSSWVKTPAQATMIVPLILLPQVILSGYVMPPVKEAGPKKVVSEIMPSYSSQLLMDASLLWNTKLAPGNDGSEKDFYPAHQNIMNKVDLRVGDVFDDDTVVRREVRHLATYCIIALLFIWLGLKRREAT